MQLIIAVKRIAAIVLLLAFFLPLSQCSVMEKQSPGKASVPSVEVTYAYATYDEEFPTPVLAYVGFLWPLGFSIAGLLRPPLMRRRGAALSEMVLCVGSGYVLYVLASWGETRYGAYVAATAIGLYFVSASADVAIRVRAALRSG